MLRQIGFAEDEALIANDKQNVFVGFDYLREYFTFPRRFLGVELRGLGTIAPKLPAKTVDIIFALDDPNAAVSPRLCVKSSSRSMRRRRSISSRRRWIASPSRPINTNISSFPIAAGCSTSRSIASRMSSLTFRAGPRRSLIELALYRCRGQDAAATGLCYNGASPAAPPATPRSGNTVINRIIPEPMSSSRLDERSDPEEVRFRSRGNSASFRPSAPIAICPNTCRSAKAAPISGFLDDVVQLDVRWCIAGPTRPSSRSRS